MQIFGTSQGWQKTNVVVQPGERITVRAAGWIKFAARVPFSNGFPRNPDGADEHGAKEVAGPQWPAPNLVRNSLVLRVGNWVVQAGSSFSGVAPVGGVVELTNNDDQSGDNDGAWNVELSVARPRLHQQGLVLVQGAQAQRNLPFIQKHRDQFLSWMQAFQPQIAVESCEVVPFRSSEPIPAFSSGHPHIYDPKMAPWLQKGTPGLDLSRYQFIFLVFDQGQGPQPGARGYTWGLWRYSTIPYWLNPGDDAQNKLLGEVMLHEYIHQFDGFLADAGVPQAIDPDTLGTYRNFAPFFAPPPHSAPIIPGETPPEVMLAFYKGLLNVMDTRTPAQPALFSPIPIQRLDGRFGKWMA